MGTISGCSHLKLNLKAKIYIYVNATTQRCSNKIIKNFQFEDFCHLPPVSATPVVHHELRISPRIFKKFETALLVYSGAWGKLIHEKNQKSKISWHCPFKDIPVLLSNNPARQHYLKKFQNSTRPFSRPRFQPEPFLCGDHSPFTDDLYVGLLLC
jgi:hypothetical protein